jgi:hypothetical protein
VTQEHHKDPAADKILACATVVDIIAPGLDVKSTWIGPKNDETNTISGTSMGEPLPSPVPPGEHRA